MRRQNADRDQLKSERNGSTELKGASLEVGDAGISMVWLAISNQTVLSGLSRYSATILLLWIEHPTTGTWRSSIARLALRQGLPTLFARDHANQEGLLTYGTSFVAAARRAPRFLNAMLDGKPGADNLIEHLRCPELLVNRAAAAAIDLMLPDKLDARAL